MIFISEEDKQVFATWKQYDDAEDSFCYPEGEFYSLILLMFPTLTRFVITLGTLALLTLKRTLDQ